MSEFAAKQGYVTQAYGKRRFFEMAINTALSVKLHDPKRPVCLIHNVGEEISEDVARAFDHVAAIENPGDYPKGLLKFGIYEPSPYEESLYLDADCVLLKPDMDRHWEKYGASDFMIAGNKVTSGNIFGSDVAAMMEAGGIPYVINMNGGLLFFRKGAFARQVFEDCRAMGNHPLPAFQHQRLRRGDGQSDQPIFSYAMAKNQIDPIGYTPEEGTIMATTYRARKIDFDILAGRGDLEKPAGFYLLGRFLAKGWVKHSTSVGHFIDAKPLPLYQKMSDELRGHFGWPLYEFPG